MRRILILIGILALLFNITTYATIDIIDNEENIEETAIDEIERTINEINIIRENVNLNLLPIQSNKILKEMALNHSKYMNYNGLLTTIEESDLEFFRGRFPWDRASYYEYEQDFVYEFVKKDISNYMVGFQELINDPVSRNVIFNPMYNEIGMGVEEDYITYELGGITNRDQLFVQYPYKEQEDIPVFWQGDSYDDLAELVSTEVEEFGFPITVAHYGTGIQRMYDIEVTLVEMSTGDRVPFEIIEPSEYYQLKNVITILPLERFSYNTTYAASIKFKTIMKDASNEEYSQVFTFTTETLVREKVEKKYLTRGDFTEKVILNNPKYKLIEPLEYKFTDVAFDTPQSIYIYTASEYGLIQGVGSNMFRPELNITKEQAFKILVLDYELNFREIEILDETILSSYKDEAAISVWAYTYVQKAHELGIITNNFDIIQPGNYLTEDEFNDILILYNKYIEGIDEEDQNL